MRYYYFIFLFIFSSILPFSAYALSIEPTGYRAILEPNTAEEFIFTLENSTEQTRTVTLLTADGFDILTPSSISSWMQFPESVTLPPNSTTPIVIGVTTPISALPGDNYSYLIVQETQGAGAVAIAPELGVPLTITIAGEIQERLEVTSFDVSISDRELLAELSLSNTGMVEVPISGTVVFKDSAGTILFEESLQRSIRASDTHSETYRAPLPRWYVGYVNVSFLGTYGVFSEQISTTLRLWYVAPLVQGVMGGIILLMLLCIYFYNKKRRLYVK
jgi:hypothetical protein